VAFESAQPDFALLLRNPWPKFPLHKFSTLCVSQCVLRASSHSPPALN